MRSSNIKKERKNGAWKLKQGAVNLKLNKMQINALETVDTIYW